MTVEDAEFSDVTAQPNGRRGDGGIYLVVADDSDEFAVALRYAARMARSNRGHLGILNVLNINDVQQWENVEAMMRREMREQAEKFIWSVAKKVNDLNGMIPALYVLEGVHDDVLINLINNDSSIRMLILGGGTSATGPGPLVSYFTGKGLGRLRIPVLVVPGHLDQQKIDAIT
jgi:nucleotide-binding universal stress UspA family protein